MDNAMLGRRIELRVPAQREMMLVLRLTTAGVVARAGLGVDRMDDVKMAVEEACSLLLGSGGATGEICLHFTFEEDFLTIVVCGDCKCEGGLPREEMQVVRCILESLVDDVDICHRDAGVGQVTMRVNVRV